MPPHVKSAQNSAPRYTPEVLSPQQQRAWKEKFGRHSRSQLKEIGSGVSLAYRGKAVNQEKEIAVGHIVRTAHIGTYSERRRMRPESDFSGQPADPFILKYFYFVTRR
jgi:hypothetical protein